eukprot:819656-Rhodomonas_salina.1
MVTWHSCPRSQALPPPSLTLPPQCAFSPSLSLCSLLSCLSLPPHPVLFLLSPSSPASPSSPSSQRRAMIRHGPDSASATYCISDSLCISSWFSLVEEQKPGLGNTSTNSDTQSLVQVSSE